MVWLRSRHCSLATLGLDSKGHLNLKEEVTSESETITLSCHCPFLVSQSEWGLYKVPLAVCPWPMFP